ncbi:Cytosolic Fe-S cluster assembly factor nar1 [Recurvomyces mirabilis]|uniref:Nuclear architecture-related protein 1 n=1 Tax=Recurvomyces mirabilis TaxID=574656 RepID=A0AAE0WJ81_9PEZI|nr:Cytosolic Fe-S cluster assembly factor nar1 [Recurvomyces mirabilis]KAK5159848.1 Cytosolic Fe-S cluster assembly factor nar1 [Recurvomyces mirabilis]
MSAILSADDLNDFINPGVACIKPVETLPKQQPIEDGNPYEVTTEEKIQASQPPPPAQISLTDCLACSGCVTSAEAVLSHSEVLDTLDRHAEIKVAGDGSSVVGQDDGKIFVATVSPQTRASLAATYKVSEREAGHVINQLLSGPYGLRSGGIHGSGFNWVVDTNVMREVALVSAADEAQLALETPSDDLKRPVLTSACPGWICYAEKTHPYILPHLSKLKSPQALTGTLLKSVLSKKLGVRPDQIWHMAIMPCFDKKLEASRAELTSHTWHGQEGDAVRDVDCVITARELLMLAESRNISFPCLPRTPLPKHMRPAFPDPHINDFLFGRRSNKRFADKDTTNTVGTSGGYLHHILQTQQRRNPESSIRTQRGRNSDVVEYSLVSPNGEILFKAARYYGFRNIQNLVRKLRPARPSRMPGAASTAMRKGRARKPGGVEAGGGTDGQDYAYVEVMACPGGCTNGGGQIKIGDVLTLRQVGGTGVENGSTEQEILPMQREWLGLVDEAYWSAEDSGKEDEDVRGPDGDGDVDMHNGDDCGPHDDDNVIDGIDRRKVHQMLQHWSEITSVELDKLVCTTYRAVESNVGKNGGEASEVEKVSALAVAAGGGW